MDSPGQDTGMGSSLLQGIFPTQGLNSGLPQCRRILYQLSHRNTGGGCHFLLRGIFLTEGLNLSLLCLLPWQVDALLLHHLEDYDFRLNEEQLLSSAGNESPYKLLHLTLH